MSTTPVIIESKIKRPDGSTITLGETTYKFIPDEEGRHVATVENPQHIEKFLSVTEGFRLLLAQSPVDRKQAEPQGVQQPVAPATAAPTPSQEPVTAPEPNPVPSETPATAAPKETPASLAQMSDEDLQNLRTKFEQEVGRKPHPSAKAETMIAQIEAAIEAKNGAE